MSDNYQFKIADYDGIAASWPDLEKSSQQGCRCGKCNKQFTVDDPMEMGCRCHPGSPTYVSYWDGWLYFRCATCDHPVIKIPVSKSLL